MGSVSSTEESRSDYEKARASFSPDEISYFDKLFDRFSTDESSPSKKSPSKTGGKITWATFEKKFGSLLDKNYQRKFFDALSAMKNTGTKENADFVTRQLFTIGLARLFKDSSDEKAQIFLVLCETDDKHSADTVPLDEVILSIEQFAVSYVKIISQSPTYAIWRFNTTSSGNESENEKRNVESLVDYYAHDLHNYLTKAAVSHDNQLAPTVLIEKWLCNAGSFVLEMMGGTFRAAFNEILQNPKFTYPSIPTPLNNTHGSTLLNLSSILLLTNHLSLHDEKNWRLLYNSASQGESFTQMLKSIVNEGPLLVVVREKESGYVFGGFSSVNLNPNPNFIGDDRCFVFTLHPHIRVYSATGFNNNYVYLNAHQATMPNGLGFGGRLEVDDVPVHFFALWIDHDFGRGKSQGACSTFNNPQLSANENFTIGSIEIWSVGQGPNMKRVNDSKSVLDSNPEVKAMLAMTGKGPLSEGLREHDETADIPEERKFSIS